ncbi:PEP-CTERM sorting domain-containing protein [Syntrophotalea acetylenivorans]|nr:PEP-CTERM sorting domain-containing protein [Syntrophotalea acetylenivorans]
MHKHIKLNLFKLFLFIAIFFLSGNASATTTTLSFFEHSTFSTLSPGEDGLYGTGDDLTIPIVSGHSNNSGAASVGSTLPGLYVNLTGSNVFAAPLQVGVNTMVGLDTGIETLTGNETAVLDSTATNELIWNADNTFSTAFTHLISNGDVNVLTHDNSLGYYLLNGQDPNAIFETNPDLATHFNFLIPLLPNDWTVVTTNLFESAYTAPGYGTQSFFASVTTVQTSPVPEPSTVLLLGVGIVGVIGMRLRQRTS